MKASLIMPLFLIGERELKHIPGPREGSYMALDLEIPYTAVQYKYNGHYAVLFRGLWTVVNDFMAGRMS